MKRPAFLLPLFLLTVSALAGESHLTVTWQPLSGLGTGGIRICEVACHDWYAHSGPGTAINLISARNVPPTNNAKEATQDLNFASACGLVFGHTDLGAKPQAEKPELILDATKFRIPETLGKEEDRETIVRSALECLRRVTEKGPFSKLPLTLKASDADKAWLGPIVSEFTLHDRSKVFYTPAD